MPPSYKGWTVEKLRTFEADVTSSYEKGLIRAPVHLSGGNEEQLINIFAENSIDDTSWCLSTHRAHYHALLKGVPPELVMAEILAGRSIHLSFPEYRFYTSAIVGGICPIAVGLGMGLKRRGEDSRVWAFIGDMASTMGIFHECTAYAWLQRLPVTWVIADDGLSTNTPTWSTWGYSDGRRLERKSPNIIHFSFVRTHPHIGVGKWVDFDKQGKPPERSDVMG